MHGNSTPPPFVEDEASRPAPARTQRPSQRRRSRMQRQLIDGFSHDVRTPITVINEYLSLLADDFDPPDADEHRKMLDVICDRVDDLNRTFSNFVDALRLDARALARFPLSGRRRRRHRSSSPGTRAESGPPQRHGRLRSSVRHPRSLLRQRADRPRDLQFGRAHDQQFLPIPLPRRADLGRGECRARRKSSSE